MTSEPGEYGTACPARLGVSGPRLVVLWSLSLVIATSLSVAPELWGPGLRRREVETSARIGDADVDVVALLSWHGDRSGPWFTDLHVHLVLDRPKRAGPGLDVARIRSVPRPFLVEVEPMEREPFRTPLQWHAEGPIRWEADGRTLRIGGRRLRLGASFHPWRLASALLVDLLVGIAAGSLAAVALDGLVRHHQTRRWCRGRCPLCVHPLPDERQAGCVECGWARETR